MDRLHAWLEERKDQYAPKSPMASAVRYALNSWQELTRFLDDAQIPPDNNRSESALRVVADGWIIVRHSFKCLESEAFARSQNRDTGDRRCACVAPPGPRAGEDRRP